MVTKLVNHARGEPLLPDNPEVVIICEATVISSKSYGSLFSTSYFGILVYFMGIAAKFECLFQVKKTEALSNISYLTSKGRS